VLLALDAVAAVVGAGGVRGIPFASFYPGYRRTALRPGEILGWVRIPDPPPAVQAFRKVGTRQAQAISKVVVALAAARDGARWVRVRVAAGSVAATPVRLHAAEAVLEGAVPDAATADRAGAAAAGEVTPIDDVRSTAAYRRFALGRVVRRLVLEAGAGMS
jgi:xanthine dehydrogenase small subunit